ncbi:translocon-associated protein subunit delta [Plakobranchus ocellatus]|uniref:Translocon-associated protein subunit delta n=1 Tax=Plakobranchus ocellatus TaxID=259542 RepID=A0AAV3YB98_9GAST|nr:translocon-associated protein subunit delta [Plakobranchus ocellatus]
MNFSLEKSGAMKKSDLDSKDVFILDTKSELFVWIGRQTSLTEKQNAMTYAHNYLMKTDHPLVPVSCLKEGSNMKAFEMAIAA